jgi:hypothetical protein
MQKEYKHPFLYFGIFSLEMSSATIPQISPLLHSGLRIFVLTIQKDQATRTEDIAQKPFRLQTMTMLTMMTGP